MTDEVREFVDWARSRRAAHVEVPTKAGVYKVTFREPTESEILADIEAKMTAADRAARANMSDEEREKLEREERERLLYGGA